MPDGYLWQMLRVDRDALEVGEALSIVLWDMTVITVGGINGDYTIHMFPCNGPTTAYELALMETSEAERRGLEVRNIYGCRDLGGGFAMAVTEAHKLFRTHQLQALEYLVKDIVTTIQREGERLDA